MRFLFWVNSSSDVAKTLAEKLSGQLLASGHALCGAPEEADFIVVLGGDGTVLRAVKTLRGLDKPLWAVNCGHLGYLSDCGPEEAPEALARILRGEYHLERRSQLCGDTNGEPLFALNEALFHRGACGRALQIQVLVNGSLALRYRGDGLLVSTPSGSTAYNLSAGGPVLMPEMELLALTPVCPQALSAMPLVVSAADTVRVSWRMENYAEERETPLLIVDGEEKRALSLSGTAEFSGPVRRVALVRTREADFYGRLLHRMRWNAYEGGNA
ncbi:MAG: NAD(+)/NADH kinase [Clostridia bacterium]|nr:NAD(+)/NADH kinase [Clostridia bacterium]